MNETDWERGNRAAWVHVLEMAVRQLGYQKSDNPSWISERERAIQMLRSVCEEHGDNDWGEGLPLADIIENHLLRHLES